MFSCFSCYLFPGVPVGQVCSQILSFFSEFFAFPCFFVLILVDRLCLPIELPPGNDIWKFGGENSNSSQHQISMAL